MTAAGAPPDRWTLACVYRWLHANVRRWRALRAVLSAGGTGPAMSAGGTPKDAGLRRAERFAWGFFALSLTLLVAALVCP